MTAVDHETNWNAIVPDGALYALQRDRMHHSPAVRAGELLICSGVIGVEASGKLVVEPAAQIERAFENLSRLLADCGAGLADVAELLTFHVDLDLHIGRFVKAKDRLFVAAPYPAWTAVGACFIEPGSPWQNGHNESFNGVFRDGCLNRWLFESVREARETTEAWLQEYNEERPHGSLGGLTPSEFFEQGDEHEREAA